MQNENQKEHRKKSLPEKLLPFVDGKADSVFEYFIILVIIINSVCLGIETSPNISAAARHALDVIDRICLAIFVVELSLKIIAFNKNFFTATKWNAFDLIIILISVFANIPSVSVFRGIRIFRAARLLKAFRSLRIVKSLKIINSLEHLQIIVKAIVFAIPSIIWTFMILLLIFYFYAIIGVNVFGTEFAEFFGSLGKAFLTLFQLMLFDSWSFIARQVIKIYPPSWIYFVSFGIISAYTILQVVTGIVVDSIQSVAKNNSETDAEKNQTASETFSAQIAALQKQMAELSETLERAIR